MAARRARPAHAPRSGAGRIPRRGPLLALVAGGVAVATVVVASIVWPGLDAQETPPVDTTVWALQTGEGTRYARVNTSILELDTVRTVSDPSQVAQSSAGTFLFTGSNSRVTRVDEALPVDLDDEALRESPATPDGTVEVVTAGEFVVYRTESGVLYTGTLSEGRTPTRLEPFPSDDEDAPSYAADAVALDDRGILLSFSEGDGSVLTYDIPASSVRSRDVVSIDDPADPAITGAGDAWVLVDREDGSYLVEGTDAARPAPVTGAVVASSPDPDGDAVYLASDTGLARIPVDGGEPEPVVGDTTLLGTPAQPLVQDGVVHAAWLAEGDLGGQLWTSERGTLSPLDYAGQELSDQRRPVFTSNGDTVILNETRTGWVWTVPDGRLVPSSQRWSLDDEVVSDAQPSEEQLSVVIDPKAPIAEPDAFGVRPGALVSLPVLLNDHDPNEDVLSVDPASVTGLDPGFGTVSITDDGQRLAVRVAPGASGAASFSYAVTDGTAPGGLASPSTTVTLLVAGDEQNGAPVWCGVERCLAEWPSPEVARGGTVTVPVMTGWVDPDGDPMLLLSAENASGVGKVAATPAGDIVYQHADDGSGAEQLIEIVVSVADTRGAVATKSLVIRVSPQPTLSMQSFAVVDTVGATTTVDVGPHVTGTAGTVRLDAVRVLDDARASATIVGGSTSFDFRAEEPGTYRVDVTVTDGTTQENGTVRVTALAADAPTELATAPVVAFVRPQQDATLDILAAVSNPTRRVLLLSDVQAQPDAGASLSFDTLSQNYLRVSGSTADGAPGRLGTITYTVTDGTENQGSSVEGQATVYLLPPAPELAPIAVDDTVVVRAGTQIDIPVLENDVAPAGGRPTLNPATVTSTSPAALAFGAGEVLRYLAPDEPGEYAVDYDVYTTGAPSLSDQARVTVQVLPDDENRAPAPDTVEGRVLSGQSTRIEFDGYGVDPDGDTVSLDRIIAQPESGVATISAEGDAIVYTSVSGFSGQVTFPYRVVDEFGQTGEGIARVGVLDSDANPSPVTFTDYVQVQAGADSTIRVNPLSNDSDPTMGELTVEEVRPDVPETLEDGSENPEFARLDERIRSVGERQVVIAAGTEPGTMSFLYDVSSTSGNTGRGLIVVTVVRESVPDYPVVEDTVLTAETREDFVDGVDVLSGNVSWSGGDINDLELALWGEPGDVAVRGSEISGPLPDTTRVIPFSVTGEGASGEVTSYGFLRVPGDADLSLALRSSARPVEVPELESVTFDMDDLVAIPRNADLEVGDDVRASGARGEAVCTAVGDGQIRYDAGAGAPWTDACQVPVRVAGTEDFTYLAVPILVEATDPQPELRPGALTVGPGETATFDLRNMTTWQLREDWDGIAYALSYPGGAFEVSLEGSIVTVTGADTAVPGREEVVTVSAPSHPNTPPSRLILRVGQAPSTLPQGGSVTQQCSQAGGSSCTITVIGAAGEINPLPRTPLEVVDVRPTGACAGVSFQVSSPRTVTASWAPDAPGATCSATFSVVDAQGRRTAGERDGRVLLDLQGFPRPPAALVQTAFGNESVTLRVDPGDARLAYPGLSGFRIRYAGQVVAECGPGGTCPPISAPNGERRTYEAVAVNAVGESRGAVRTEAWAYDAPPAPSSVQWIPLETRGEGGYIALRIEGVDPSRTGSLEITSPTGERSVVNVGSRDTTVDVRSYRVGSNAPTPVTVTPYSRFDRPPGLGGGGVNAGASVTVNANGVGAPLSPALDLESVSDGDGTSTITARASAGPNGAGSTLRFGIVQEGDRCVTSDNGATATFPGFEDGEEYEFEMCVDSVFQGEVYGTATATATVRAAQSAAAPTGYTFVVDGRPNVGQNRADWIIRDQPTSNAEVPNRNQVRFSGLPSTVFGQDPRVRVWYEHQFWGTRSAEATVTPREGSAPWQMTASWRATSCVGGSTLTLVGDSSTGPGGNGAAISFSPANLRYFDADNNVLPHTADSFAVPQGADRVEGITVTVDWSARGWGLQNVTERFSADCQPGAGGAPPTNP
ncbi:Ig-like domain-containing protein [Microbacterium kunmingense]|uniref:Ig-like domain-containing protein n=1 Tax=Microbacterium kunmingense TaxID=2915939 RepID=UPI00200580E2|nr:Ig-like domain-containing protein [Microbacterium kunmingense]